ncbi:MAG: hypothetical protein U9R27_12630 [Campylobacterota bacterium]|nr:hypothetical protein [Campylobacterota bacterium]
MTEKKQKSSDPIPARVYAAIPTDSYTALVLCRRRAKETGVFRWDLLTDKITVSQWLKSRIHESLSDISPDGEHFIYTANDKGHSYTAISKAPWIKATCFWWDRGFWGGGFFIDNGHYLLHNGKVGNHKFIDKSLIGVTRSEYAEKHQPFNAIDEVLFGEHTFCARFMKSGWDFIGKEKKTYIFRKKIDEDYLLEKRVHGYNPDRVELKGKGSFWEDHAIIHRHTTNEKPDWEWCEIWHGCIYYSEKGSLYKLEHITSNAILLYDFNEETFVCNRAPY